MNGTEGHLYVYTATSEQQALTGWKGNGKSVTIDLELSTSEGRRKISIMGGKSRTENTALGAGLLYFITPRQRMESHESEATQLEGAIEEKAKPELSHKDLLIDHTIEQGVSSVAIKGCSKC